MSAWPMLQDNLGNASLYTANTKGPATTNNSASGIGGASMAMMAVGAVASMFGAYYAAKSAKTQLNYQAEMGRINAQMSETAAQTALLGGQRDEQTVRLRTAGLKSRQRAAMAANGIDLGSDTAQNILNTTDYMGEVDAQTVQKNAITAAWGYRTQGMNTTAQANASAMSARGVNPNVAATSSLLGNAGTVAMNYAALKRSGAFD